jgi:hypothetical protein
MNIEEIGRYGTPHGDVSLRIGSPEANRILLALERLDQESGLDPALAELREHLKTALITKSSGDTDSAPSTE